MVHQDGDHHDIPKEHRVKKHGSWLPADHRIHHAWLAQTVKAVDQRRADKAQDTKEAAAAAGKDEDQAYADGELTPVLREFRDLVRASPRLRMYFASMWDEVPQRAPYNRDPTGQRSQIRDFDHLLAVLDHVFGRAPEWTDAAAHVGMVGVPMCAVFDYVMGTPSGHAAFLDPEVNAMLKKVLCTWGEYLKTPESAEVLGDHETGWFGKTGLHDLMQVANAPYKTDLKFEEMYQCDPSKKYYGFKSWDDFFTRKLQPSARPVASPDDDDVIANACESRVYNVAHNVRLHDRFWIKEQPYSVGDMLAADALAAEFAGGTVYQAFLSALSYHRWHAPVSGVVRRAFVRDGTFFSEPLFEATSGPDGQIDPQGIALAQGYLTAMATRAVIFIQADSPRVGLMAFVGVGMDEVSTCEIAVREGQRVRKGDELGMFHFGGSSHCLLFRKGVNVAGFPEVGRAANVPVRGQVAVVSP